MIQKGNIHRDQELHPELKGWIAGSFLPKEAPLFSENIEIKFVEHTSGETRVGSTSTYPKKSIDIVLIGKCRFLFPSHKQEYILEKGDYITYDTSACTHTFQALSDCSLIIIRTPSLMSQKSTTLFDLPLYNGTYQGFLQKIQNPNKKTLVFTPNPEIFVRANRDKEFMEVLEQATYNVPDGNGLYVGYMMLEGKGFIRSVSRTFFQKKSVEADYGELIKGSDLTRDILESGTIHPQNILVIDRKNAVPKNDLEVKKAALQSDLKATLEKKYPRHTIFVVFAGEKTPEQIAELISSEKITTVFSCVGMKNQEKLLIEIFAYLPADQKVVGLGVGASIDFLFGLQKRAPQIFQKLSAEWLYRLITQPKIRTKRIWDAIYHFPMLIKKSSKS